MYLITARESCSNDVMERVAPPVVPMEFVQNINKTRIINKKNTNTLKLAQFRLMLKCAREHKSNIIHTFLVVFSFHCTDWLFFVQSCCICVFSLTFVQKRFIDNNCSLHNNRASNEVPCACLHAPIVAAESDNNNLWLCENARIGREMPDAAHGTGYPCCSSVMNDGVIQKMKWKFNTSQLLQPCEWYQRLE